jgi:hypothetical protein
MQQRRFGSARFQFVTRVAFPEVGPSGRLGLVPLADHLQEAAAEDARHLGVSIDRLAGLGLGWVMSRLVIRIERWPRVTPRLSDLDINGHVNNAQLLGWTLEPLPLEVSSEQVLREIDVQFRHECRRDDRIAARVEAKDGGVFHHSVIFVDNGRELCERARSGVRDTQAARTPSLSRSPHPRSSVGSPASPPRPAVSSLSTGSPGSPDRENLASLVERVTFHNEDSGFCVLRVKARGQRDLITIIGDAAIGAGEFVQASGRWVNDRTHGVQFRADFLRAAPRTTAEGIEKYLASGMNKGPDLRPKAGEDLPGAGVRPHRADAGASAVDRRHRAETGREHRRRLGGSEGHPRDHDLPAQPWRRHVEGGAHLQDLRL